MRRWLVLTGILVVAAVCLVPVATRADTHVSLGINIGAPPQLVVVPGSPVYYAPALPYNYFRYGGQYYVFQSGAWYVAPVYNGPWAVIAFESVPRPILEVPVRYYPAPPPHWKEHGHGPPPWAPAWGHRKKGD